MRDEWYVARRGQDGNKRYGPVPLAQLLGLMDAGRVSGEDLVWREGMANWRRADQCEELSPPARPRGDPAGPRRAYGPDDDDDRPYRRRYPPPRSSSNGPVVGLVIGGIVLGVLVLGCGGLSFVSYLFSRSVTTYTTPSYSATKPAFPQDEEVMPNVVLGGGALALGAALPPYGQSTVYYTANVNAGMAKAVGDYLSNVGHFPADHGTVVQVDRDPVSGTYRVRFCLRIGVAWDPDTFDYFRDLRGELEAGPLAGNAVQVELCDPNMNTLRTIHAGD